MATPPAEEGAPSRFVLTHARVAHPRGTRDPAADDRARPSLWIALSGSDQGARAPSGVAHTGLGEASPLAGFSRDDIAACERTFAAAPSRLAALDPSLPADIAVARALDPLAGELAATPSARFALETALCDLLAQRRGVSIAELVGGARPYCEVAVNGLLEGGAPETLADRAAELAAIGLRAIKIKLRAHDDAGFARELDALHAVRRALPEPFEIRLDPNARWSLAVARERLAALAPIAPAYVEQPVAAADLASLGACAVPWAADESLAIPEVARAILQRPEGCAAFVLKPAILGFFGARDLALRALDRGLGVVVTHLMDGPIALASACELALSLPRAPLACGLDLHDRLATWPPVAIPQLARRGVVVPASRAGLGVAFEEVREWMR